MTKVREEVAEAEVALATAREGHTANPSAAAHASWQSPGEAIKKAQGELEKAQEKLKSYEVPPPPIENFFYVAFSGRCFMGATSHHEDVVKPLVNLLTHAGERVPGTYPVFFQTSLFGRIGGRGNSIELEIRGPDLDEVTAAAEVLHL